MKLLMKNVFAMSCCMISFFGMSASEKSRPEKHVDVKCYVELVGGGETVAFWNVTEKQVNKLAHRIHGHKVKSPISSKKQAIYKVHECVLLKEDFSSENGKQVDKKTAK